MERGNWMYEEMTYNNIMAMMMEEAPDGMSTDEGSIIYNACTKMALKLEEIFVVNSYLYDNLSPDTMDEEHSRKYATNERGITINEATAAIMQGEFNQEIEIGTRFTLNDLNYIATSQIEEYEYELECEETGRFPNSVFGELAPIDFVENWQGGKITKVLVPGTDGDDVEAIREKVMASFFTKAFAGNKQAYKDFFHNFDGIGGVKIKRRDAQTGWINATIITSEYDVPEQQLITKVQTAIDPEVSHGEGDGQAPIGHKVLVAGVREVKIDIEAHIDFDEGYNVETSRSYIESAIDEYLLSLRKEWEDSGTLMIRVFQVIASMAKVTGILDINNVKLNGVEANITLEEDQIPKRGTVNVI